MEMIVLLVLFVLFVLSTAFSVFLSFFSLYLLTLDFSLQFQCLIIATTATTATLLPLLLPRQPQTEHRRGGDGVGIISEPKTFLFAPDKLSPSDSEGETPLTPQGTQGTQNSQSSQGSGRENPNTNPSSFTVEGRNVQFVRYVPSRRHELCFTLNQLVREGATGAGNGRGHEDDRGVHSEDTHRRCG